MATATKPGSTTSQLCLAIGCSHRIRTDRLFCAACWREIPWRLRVDLTAVYKPADAANDASSPFVRAGYRCTLELAVQRQHLTRDEADRLYVESGISPP